LASRSEQPELTRFVRSGGVGGSRLELDLEHEQMSADERAAWDELVATGALERPGPPASGQVADAYQYDLTVRRGDERQTLTFDEFSLAPELEPLIELLERHATEARRRGG
jgi:hypothetical protein